MSFRERKAERNIVSGMERALMHAFDMNKDDKLSAREFDDVRRFIIQQSIDEFSMDDWVRGREDGTLSKLMDAAGQDPDEDEELDWDSLSKRRQKAVMKVIKHFLEMLHDTTRAKRSLILRVIFNACLDDRENTKLGCGNARGVATARGGEWSAVQVGSILQRVEAY